MCKEIKSAIKITYEEKCSDCGQQIYSEEIQEIYSITNWGGFRTRHDLGNMREALEKVKKDPKCKTALGGLWIDSIIDDLRKMEQKFTNPVVAIVMPNEVIAGGIKKRNAAQILADFIWDNEAKEIENILIELKVIDGMVKGEIDTDAMIKYLRLFQEYIVAS